MTTSGQAIVFSGPGIAVYRALAIKQGLQFYAKTGMRLNRMYTPKNMLAAASSMTGKTYKRTTAEYLRAADDLQALVDGARA